MQRRVQEQKSRLFSRHLCLLRIFDELGDVGIVWTYCVTRDSLNVMKYMLILRLRYGNPNVSVLSSSHSRTSGCESR